MTKFHCVVLMLVLGVIGIGPCLADTVTVDPNAPRANPAASTQADKVTADPNAPAASVQVDSDKRLAQPVTYESGYKRLHSITDELTAQTKVAIRAGDNKDDWIIRDLPLIVSAKDVPLGNLLSAIANASNLDFISSTVKSDAGETQKQYRLSITKRTGAAIGETMAVQRDTAHRKMDQMWDAMVANADVPDADVNIAGSDHLRQARAVAKILKALGSDAKAKVMSNQRIDLTTASFGDPTLLRDWYRATCDQYRRLGKVPEPTDDDIDKITFSFVPHDDPVGGRFHIDVILSAINLNDNVNPDQTVLEPMAIGLWTQTKGHKQPSVIEEQQWNKTAPDRTSKDCQPLSIESGAMDAPEFMSRKVTLDLPTDRDVSYAEALTALSEASGLAIVAEDFFDHKQTTQLTKALRMFAKPASDAKPAQTSPQVGNLGQDTTVGDVLRAIAEVVKYDPARFEWFYTEKGNVLIAKASDWIRAHRNLVPESLLLELSNQAMGDGVQLDSLAKLTLYSQPQITEWVGESRNLSFLHSLALGESQTLWSIYVAMTPQDKALAKSDSGLQLAKFDTAWLAALMGIQAAPATSPAQPASAGTAKGSAALLTDPEVLKAMTLKIVRQSADLFTPPTTESTDTASKQPVSPPSNQYTYSLMLAGAYNGEQIQKNFGAIYAFFPIYSPERKAQLTRR